MPVELQARDLVALDGPRPLTRPLSFSVIAGQRVALTGPSGAGKSLALRCLVGLHPCAGLIMLNGQSLDRLPPSEARSRVLLVAQAAARLPGTAEENLHQIWSLAVIERRAARWEEVLEWCARLGISDQLGQDAADLSGGELQRLALVRALKCNPDVLLLDEPTAALDASTVAQVEEIIRTWQGSQRAVVLVTHDAAQTRRFATETVDVRPL